jgi:sugar phosphate isomerase/epimerase
MENDFVKAGFHSGYLQGLDVLAAIEAVASAGYDAIEINAEALPWAKPHVGPDTTETRQRAIKEAASDHALMISSVAAHCEVLSIGPDAAMAFTRACTDLASNVGAPVVHVLSGVLPAGRSSREAWGELVQFGRDAAACGEERGIRIGWEAVVGMPVAGLADMERLLADVDHPNLGVNFDPSHYEVVDGSAIPAAERLASRVVNVHVKDAAGTPANFTFPPLGLGTVDFAAVFRALRDGGFDGVAAVEYEGHVMGHWEIPADEILRTSRSYLRDKLGF